MHVRRALALALTVPLLLAGCSEDPEPTPQIPDPTRSSPTPTATATESETPEAEGPEDFIRRWVEANTRMQNTGEVDEYRSLSTKCKPCIQTSERVEQIYADGGFVDTEGWLVKDIVDKSGSGGPVLDLQIRSSPTKLKESAEAEAQSLPGGEIVMRVRLSRTAPWQVVQLTQVPS